MNTPEHIAGAAVIVCLSTAPSLEVAERLARDAVQQGLAACVSFVPGATSVYAWKGDICQDAEVWMLIKTTQQALPQLQQAWTQWHPYEVPELLVLPVTGGLPAYLDWVCASVNTASGA